MFLKKQTVTDTKPGKLQTLFPKIKENTGKTALPAGVCGFVISRTVLKYITGQLVQRMKINTIFKANLLKRFFFHEWYVLVNAAGQMMPHLVIVKGKIRSLESLKTSDVLHGTIRNYQKRI